LLDQNTFSLVPVANANFDCSGIVNKFEICFQEEESQWQDFAEDEVLVKDQLADALLQSLLADTLESFVKIYKRRKARQEEEEDAENNK
jgi:hypothetical protein